jgi:GTP pyrophosphokinase
MHRVAESGIAAHWSYKEGGGVQMRDQERFNWLKQLIEWAQEVRNPDEFMETVQSSLFVDQVFAFTPKGDLMVMPKGATPLDFAYEIHTEVGHACTGARVNNRLVPLSTPLRSGDLVEILTSKGSRPKRDWLSFAATSRAQNKIRQWLQAEERTHAVEIGRQMLEKELRRHGLSGKRVFSGGEDQKRVLEAFRFAAPEELFRAVGIEKVRPADVVQVLKPGAEPPPEPEVEPARIAKRLKEVFKRRQEGIAVDGVEDMLLHLAKCCNPIPGDPIQAFVTRGRGVTIHVRSCPTLAASDTDRVLDAHWVSRTGGMFDAPVFAVAEDEPGVLAKITKEISERKANIASIYTRALGDGQTEVRMVLQVEDQGQLDGILRALLRIKGVTSVDRLRQAG